MKRSPSLVSFDGKMMLVLMMIASMILGSVGDYPTLICPNGAGLVKTVDHLVLGMKNGEDIEAAIDILGNQLGFPIVYPVSKFLGFQTGMVTFGNVDIESQLRSGIGFLPCSANDTLTKERVIEQGLTIEGYQELPYGSDPAFSNIFIGGLIQPSCILWPKRCQLTFTYNVFSYSQDQYREMLWKELINAHGGRLGALYADATIVRARSAANWTALLQPLAPINVTESQILWTLGGGPNVHLVLSPNTTDTFAVIVVKVFDFETAKSVLISLNLLAASSDTWAQIALPSGKAIVITQLSSWELGFDAKFLAFVLSQP